MLKVNQTKGKHDFDYYYTDEIKNQAIQVFAPYMKDFGYQMLKWVGKKDSITHQLNLQADKLFKKIIYPFRSKIKEKALKTVYMGKSKEAMLDLSENKIS